MGNEDKCPVCSNKLRGTTGSITNPVTYNCPNCGCFSISLIGLATIPHDDRAKSILSHAIRVNQRDDTYFQVNQSFIKETLGNRGVPSTNEQIDNLINWIRSDSTNEHDRIAISPKTHQAVSDSVDLEEFNSIVRIMNEKGLIEGKEDFLTKFPSTVSVNLSASGWEHSKESKGEESINQAAQNNGPNDTNKIKEELSADGTFSGVESDDGEKKDHEPFDPEKISIEPKVVSMDTLIRRITQKSIRLAPGFQRKEVWDPERKSQLVESLMLKIPIPMFYVAADEQGNWDVVDGLQRLTVIRDFILGEKFLETSDEQYRGKGFKLKNLEFWGEKYNEKMFFELPELLINRIFETEFRFTVINPGTPEEVKRNVFKRINTGGLPLTSQEIRHALYQGKSTKILEKLSNSSYFKAATARSVNDSRMAARELILRFLAFSVIHHTDYPRNSDMDKFLSNTMLLINAMPELSKKDLTKIFHNSEAEPLKVKKIEILEDRFEIAMKRCSKIFQQHAFRKSFGDRRRSPINKTLFEVWSNLFADLEEHAFENLLKQRKYFLDEYIKLIEDENFAALISKSSWKYSGVLKRYDTLSKLLRRHINNNEDNG